MTRSYSPLEINYSGDWVMSNHFYSTLVDANEDGTYSPVLASSWKKSLDGLTWTFSFSKDLKWSDGSPMTVQDIESSLNTSLKGTSHTNLSKLIKEIKAISDSTIEFTFKEEAPHFLLSLSYIDWAVVKKDLFSGPYTPGEAKGNDKILNNIKIIKNPYYAHNENVLDTNGEISFYSDCNEIINDVDNVATFRMYRDSLTDSCRAKLKEQNYTVEYGQPSWSIKADFTNGAQKRIPKEMRIGIQKILFSELKKSYKNIGNEIATGLRNPSLFGSLSLNEYENFLNSLTIANPEKLELKIITTKLWSSWKSYQFLVSKLEGMGISVSQTILDMKEFSSTRGNKDEIDKFDLVYIPLGTGDLDPDPSWRIASRYNFPGLLSEKELDEAYLEKNEARRASLYKEFSKKLISSGKALFLTINADIIGYHKDLKIKKGATLRNGTSLFDLEKSSF